MNNTFKPSNLQEIYLNNCRKNENVVHVRLLSGISITGTIVGFDAHSIIVNEDGAQKLIYKASICNIEPEEAVEYIFNEALMRDYKRVCTLAKT